jgi:hypothetical protein
MSNADFKRNFAALMQKAGRKAEMVVRASALSVGASLVRRTPVDTGRAKGNWVPGIGAANTSTSANSSGDAAVSAINQTLQAWRPGQTIYITNSLPYIKRLEDGWSKQAPAGMVRLTVVEWADSVRRAAEGIRKA